MKSMFSIGGPVSYVLVGLTFAIVSYLGFNSVQRQMYLSAPITDTFTADVIVLDFFVGEDPQVQYDRTILRSFTGAYRVEVKDATTGHTVCTGSGSNISYEQNEQPQADTSLSWYIGSSCGGQLQAGQYYLETNYTISIEGFPNRYFSTKSNVFQVLPPK